MVSWVKFNGYAITTPDGEWRIYRTLWSNPVQYEVYRRESFYVYTRVGVFDTADKARQAAEDRVREAESSVEGGSA